MHALRATNLPQQCDGVFAQPIHSVDENVDMKRDVIPTRLKKEFRVWYSPPQSVCMATFFFIKLAFNKLLKVTKTLKDLRLVTQKIHPSEFAEIIDKTHIIGFASNRRGCRTPYI